MDGRTNQRTDGPTDGQMDRPMDGHTDRLTDRLILYICDIQVRVAGVSIAAALTSTEAGRITMATQCHNVPGGIWGAAFGLLFDTAECSAVRQQVVALFHSNLLHYISSFSALTLLVGRLEGHLTCIRTVAI